ncbi:interferon gamma receptor 1 isoform X2 [Nerophis ophidion]|uniref:interferon gamma receptor 1 isoform X2 n=1 Tax=Nerophis ophidion TaxID=159077 RepID=UPI002ADF0CF9|nr:interferon gamma receptor 1 isoform X2 [Nerophis ophidion]
MVAGGAFRDLLMLLVTAVSTQPVAPPTEVTVTCYDTRVSVTWDYDQDETIFLVEVGHSGSGGRHLEDVTTAHRYDNLSALVWDSLDSAMDVHYVTLTAARGARRSPSVSATFSFNNVKMVDVICKLDFPRVDVRTHGSRTLVSFRNPLRHHPQLRRFDWRHHLLLDFIVSLVSGDVKGSCRADQETCRVDVDFPDGVDQCVKLNGTISDKAGRLIEFRQTAPVCLVQPDGEGLATMTLILFLGILIVLLTVIAIIIWRVKAWTMTGGKEDLPNSLQPRHVQSKGECIMDIDREIDIVSDVERVSLISRSDNGSSGDSTTTKISIPPEDPAPELEEEEEEEEEEEIQESPYNQPHVVVDLGDGHTALGYVES